MSFFDEIGADSIWDSGLGLFQKSAVTTLLQSETFSLEQLLAEDEFIQETQGQTPALIDYLSSPQGLRGLIYYVSVPQVHTEEDRAFRFPYMACEALCCNVGPLMDAVVERSDAGRGHLLLLFSAVQPALRNRIPGLVGKRRRRRNTDEEEDAGGGSNNEEEEEYNLDEMHDSHSHHQSFEISSDMKDPFLISQAGGDAKAEALIKPGDVRPYVIGYFAKVVAMLAKKRPTGLMRFLDRTPGIAEGLTSTSVLATAAASLLLSTLLDLPWDGRSSSMGMATLRLSRGDDPAKGTSLPALLLKTIDVALGQAEGDGGKDLGNEGKDRKVNSGLHGNTAASTTSTTSTTHAQASAATHAADLLTRAILAARSDAPHSKFAAESYNVDRMDRIRRGVAGGGGSGSGNSNSNDLSGHGNDYENNSSSSSSSSANREGGASTQHGDPLSHENVQLDPSFHDSTPNDRDRSCLRLLKSLRDGPLASTVCSLASRAATLLSRYAAVVNPALSSFSSSTGGAGATSPKPSTAVPGPVQAACDAAFRVLSAVLEACAYGWRHQVLLVDASLADTSSSSSSAAVASSAPPPPTCPFIVRLAGQADVIGILSSYLSSVSAIGNETVNAVLSLQSRRVEDEGSSSSSSTSNTSTSSLSAYAAPNGKAPAVGHDILPGIAPVPSYSLSPTLGIAGLSLARALASFSKCAGWKEAATAVSSFHVYPSLLDSMTAFPWHSILHKVITDAIVDSIRDVKEESVHRCLLFESRLLTRIVTGCKIGGLPNVMSKFGKGSNGKIGYVGHLQSMANALLAVYATSDTPAAAAAVNGNGSGGSTGSNSNTNNTTSSLLASHSGWWGVVYGELAIANIARGILLGGMAPDTKASGNVGTSADATGAAPTSRSNVNSSNGGGGGGGMGNIDGSSGGHGGDVDGIPMMDDMDAEFNNTIKNNHNNKNKNSSDDEDEDNYHQNKAGSKKGKKRSGAGAGGGAGSGSDEEYTSNHNNGHHHGRSSSFDHEEEEEEEEESDRRSNGSTSSEEDFSSSRNRLGNNTTSGSHHAAAAASVAEEQEQERFDHFDTFGAELENATFPSSGSTKSNSNSGGDALPSTPIKHNDDIMNAFTFDGADTFGATTASSSSSSSSPGWIDSDADDAEEGRKTTTTTSATTGGGISGGGLASAVDMDDFDTKYVENERWIGSTSGVDFASDSRKTTTTTTATDDADARSVDSEEKFQFTSEEALGADELEEEAAAAAAAFSAAAGGGGGAVQSGEKEADFASGFSEFESISSTAVENSSNAAAFPLDDLDFGDSISSSIDAFGGNASNTTTTSTTATTTAAIVNNADDFGSGDFASFGAIETSAAVAPISSSSSSSSATSSADPFKGNNESDTNFDAFGFSGDTAVFPEVATAASIPSTTSNNVAAVAVEEEKPFVSENGFSAFQDNENTSSSSSSSSSSSGSSSGSSSEQNTGSGGGSGSDNNNQNAIPDTEEEEESVSVESIGGGGGGGLASETGSFIGGQLGSGGEGSGNGGSSLGGGEGGGGSRGESGAASPARSTPAEDEFAPQLSDNDENIAKVDGNKDDNDDEELEELNTPHKQQHLSKDDDGFSQLGQLDDDGGEGGATTAGTTITDGAADISFSDFGNFNAITSSSSSSSPGTILPSAATAATTTTTITTATTAIISADPAFAGFDLTPSSPDPAFGSSSITTTDDAFAFDFSAMANTSDIPASTGSTGTVTAPHHLAATASFDDFTF